jgi:hypothetical protein
MASTQNTQTGKNKKSNWPQATIFDFDYLGINFELLEIKKV